MVSFGLLALVGAVISSPTTPGVSPGKVLPPARPNDDPAIRVWVNKDGEFLQGDRATVDVQTAYDGYLIVLNYDTDGRVRVLFPIDPRDDAFVEGGKRYEIEGPGDRETFDVGGSGDGMIYAAISTDPFDFDDVVDRGNWDYHRLSIDDDSDDPEADLTDLVESLSSERGFDYDVRQYWVSGGGGGGSYTVVGWRSGYPGYWDDYYCDPWGWPRLYGCRYHPGGWYISLGYYSYSPRYYSYYYYYPYYYPRHHHWYDRDRWYYRNPKHRYYYPKDRYYNVSGRPRSYTVIRRNTTGWVRTREAVSQPRDVVRKPARPRSDAPARPRSSTRARRVTYDTQQQPQGSETRTALGRRDRSGSGDGSSLSREARERLRANRRSHDEGSSLNKETRETGTLGRRSGDDSRSKSGTVRRRNDNSDSDSRSGSLGRRSTGGSGAIGRRSDGESESGSVGRRSGETRRAIGRRGGDDRSGSVGRRGGDDRSSSAGRRSGGERSGSVGRRSGGDSESGPVVRRGGGDSRSGSVGRRSGGSESGSVGRRGGGESRSGSVGRRSDGGGGGSAKGGGSSKSGGSAKSGGSGKSGGSKGSSGGGASHGRRSKS